MGETLPIFASTAANHYKSPGTLINSSVVSLNANVGEILIKLKPDVRGYFDRDMISIEAQFGNYDI